MSYDFNIGNYLGFYVRLCILWIILWASMLGYEAAGCSPCKIPGLRCTKTTGEGNELTSCKNPKP